MRRTRQVLGSLLATAVLAAAILALREEPQTDEIARPSARAKKPEKKAPAPIAAAPIPAAAPASLPVAPSAPIALSAPGEGPAPDLARLRALAANTAASQEERLTAVWELGQTKDPAAWETLVRLLQDEDEAIRAQVLCSLTPGWDTPEVVRAAADVLARDRSASVRVAAAYYLGEAKSDASAVRALVTASRAAKDADEAGSIALALGSRAEPAAQDELLRLLSDPATLETVRASAAEGLGQQGVGTPALADRIDPLLARESSPAVKHALGKAKGIALGKIEEAHDHAEELPQLGDGTLFARMADDPAAIDEARSALEQALANGPSNGAMEQALAELTEAQRDPAARARLQDTIKEQLRDGSGHSNEKGSSR